MIRLAGKRVLITGASSGLGRALAAEFARRGCSLTLAARRRALLEETARIIALLAPELPRPLVVPCDIADDAQVRRLFHLQATERGGLEVLVNNAGCGVYGPAEETPLDDIRAVMEVNFFGAVRCLREAIPILKWSGGGIILNIASAAAKYGVPFLGAYGASKAALALFAQSLRAELRGTGITVTTVFPGYIKTNFFVAEKKVGRARRPAGPYASSERVAGAIVKAVERGKRDLSLLPGGKALGIAARYFPRLADSAMAKIAADLGGGREVSHE